jgi:cell division protein FtsL
MLPVAVSVVALATVAALILFNQSRSAAVLDELRRDAADLRTQLEARDSTISTLQANIEQMGSSAFVFGRPKASSGLPTELELARQMAELTRQQSNTALVIERLLARTTDAPAPVVSARQSSAMTATLEASLQEEQQRLEAAKQRAAELLVSLNIPAEVSTMGGAQALDTASLRAYWPYFEAKRERDLLQSMVERIRVALFSQRIDAGLDKAKRDGQ